MDIQRHNTNVQLFKGNRQAIFPIFCYNIIEKSADMRLTLNRKGSIDMVLTDEICPKTNQYAVTDGTLPFTMPRDISAKLCFIRFSSFSKNSPIQTGLFPLRLQNYTLQYRDQVWCRILFPLRSGSFSINCLACSGILIRKFIASASASK